MSVKKKQILSATLVVALVAAVAVNWYYSKPGTAADVSSASSEVVENLGDSVLVAGSVQTTLPETTAAQDETTAVNSDFGEQFFASAKLKRTNTHDEMKDSIEDMLEKADANESAKSKLNAAIESYENNLKAETDTENLITGKTGGQCLVVINGSSAQVILQKGMLNDTTLIQITEIFEKNTKITSENLTVIEAK